MRIKVEQSLVADTDLKIVPSKKKKVFRSVVVKAKELREGVLFLDGGAKCDCPPLDTVNGRRTDAQLIVAGNRTRDRLVVSLIQAVDQNQGLRRALNDIRKKEGVCRSAESLVPSRRGHGGGKAEGKKKKKKKDRKTTSAVPMTNNKVARPPSNVASTSRGGDKTSDAQQNPSGSAGSHGKGKNREGRQHTVTSPRPPKKSGHRKGH